MKTLKVLLQEVVSGIKAWVNSNFAQESNAVHKTGNESIWGGKVFNSVIQTGGKICRYRPADLDSCILKMETYEWVNTAEHRPDSFGVLLALNNQENIHDSPDAGWMSQLAFATSGNIYFRNKTNLSNPWNDWKTIFHNRQNAIPYETNTYNLGSSTYQWNNVYAKNYYYNGTAWGLDKNNKWLTTNLFYGSLPIFLRGSDDIYNVSPQSLVQSLISFVDKNNTTMSNIVFQHRTEATETHRLCLRQYKVTSDGYYGVNLNNLGDFYPELNNTINLGTSTNKWKTFNGINPGALSLPRGYTEEGADKDYINIASVIQTLDGTLYYYTMPDNGWISVRAEQATQVHITTDNWKFGESIYSDTDTTLMVSTPFRKGDIVALKVRAITLEHARFYPMQGNV